MTTNDYSNPSEPTETMTFSLYGLTGYEVQYWTGSTWANVPGGSVTGNNKVWRKLTFSPITTSKIRVLTNASPDGYSRIVEVEAWGTAASSADIRWLVSDHLGTPRMIADRTGSLAGIKRHDYLPFGEELFTGIGGRTPQQGYMADEVRQKFTQKERDSETGLDYFLARYYSSAQGRFTSVDPMPIKERHLANPQDLNRYAYVANNPLAYFDPDGKEKIQVIIRTFIPKDRTGFPVYAKGDGDSRKPGVGTSHRTEVRITIETDPTKNDGNVTYGKPQTSVGPSHGLKISPTLPLGGPPIIHFGEGEATIDLTGRIARDSKTGTIIIFAKSSSAYPNLPSPSIDYGFILTVTDHNGKITTSGIGQHDGFPGYEILMQREGADQPELIYGHNPNETGDTEWSLFGSGEYYPIILNRTLKPPDQR